LERAVRKPQSNSSNRVDIGRDPKTIAKAYTADSIWRNRSSFLSGTAAIEDLLTKKWEKEKSYRLRKELFAFSNNKIAVQFWYEYQDSHDGMKWKRCYGLEDWTFAEDGKMRKRQMSGNDVEISESGKYCLCNMVLALLITGRALVRGRGRCQRGRDQRGSLVKDRRIVANGRRGIISAERRTSIWVEACGAWLRVSVRRTHLMPAECRVLGPGYTWHLDHVRGAFRPTRDVSLPGTITSSFFFVRSRSSLTSSSLSSPSTKLPAALMKDHTMLATSSALCIPLSLLPFVWPSGAVSRDEAGGTLFGFAVEDLDIRPEVRTMAPLSRDIMRVL